MNLQFSIVTLKTSECSPALTTLAISAKHAANPHPNFTEPPLFSPEGLKMSVIICPGVHSPELTQAFLQEIGKSLDPQQVYTFPTQYFPAYSACHILSFLGVPQFSLGLQFPPCVQPVLFIGFSAGVAGAIGAAQIFQRLGGQVKALIALDGWGVPLAGDFPIHRISHDRFTDWTSPLWGRNERGRNDSSFYADPSVAHLELWRSPQTAQGWTVDGQKRYATTAAKFLQSLLIQYQETENT
jgi:hypothetical protein